MKLHIGIVGPIATADIKHLIQSEETCLPVGYAGAPLISILITELLRLGHRVSAFTLSSDMKTGSNAVIAQGDNFMMNYIPSRKHAWRFNGFRPGRIVDLYQYEREQLRKSILQAEPDVVHAHWSYEFALAVLKTGLPHVVTCHDSPLKVAKFYNKAQFTQRYYRWLRVLMARKAMRQANFVTAVSSYIRDEVQDMTGAVVEVVPNPVDQFAFDLNKIRSVPVTPHFAMVCNGWQELKNPQPAMQAFARFYLSNPDSNLNLYGNDFGVGQLAENWAKEQGISAGMIFHGDLPHRQLLQDLSKLDLLLHPSLEESFGVSIAEAMAMGLPVIAGNKSGAVPWVVGNGGVLCEVQQADEIFNAIELALVPESYARFSVAASERVKTMFNANTVATAYLERYRIAIDKEFAPC